jgi:hypothetical protein
MASIELQFHIEAGHFQTSGLCRSGGPDEFEIVKMNTELEPWKK